jgi:hypothetical protein
MVLKGFGQKEEPFEGSFSGVVSGEEGHLKIDTSDVLTDIYRRGDKIIKRQTWNRKRQGIDEFASEASGLSNLGRLKTALGKAKFEAVKDEEKTKTVKGTLPTRFLGDSESEEENPNDPMAMLKLGGKDKLESIEFTATIDKESGRLAKIVYTLVKESSMGNIMMRIQGGQNPFGGGEDEEEGQDKKKKRKANTSETRVTYAMDLSTSEGKVEIPKELDKFFTE